jgi:hypothetical protein
MSWFSQILGIDAAKNAQKKADKQYKQFALPDLEARVAMLRQFLPLAQGLGSGNTSALPAYLRETPGQFEKPIAGLKADRLAQLRESLSGRGMLDPGTTSSAEVGGLVGLENWQDLATMEAERTRKSDAMAKLQQIYGMLTSANPSATAQPWANMYQQQASQGWGNVWNMLDLFSGGAASLVKPLVGGGGTKSVPQVAGAGGAGFDPEIFSPGNFTRPPGSGWEMYNGKWVNTNPYALGSSAYNPYRPQNLFQGKY